MNDVREDVDKKAGMSLVLWGAGVFITLVLGCYGFIHAETRSIEESVAAVDTKVRTNEKELVRLEALQKSMDEMKSSMTDQNKVIISMIHDLLAREQKDR